MKYTKEMAKKDGYTHYGSYYGIPVYLFIDENLPEGTIVEPKYLWMGKLIGPIASLEGFIKTYLLPFGDSYFCFKIKGKL